MKTDNNEILYNAISNIDESTIASSLNYTPKNRTILKWSGIAACFCVVAVIFAVMYSNNQNDVVNDNSTVATPSVTTASGDCTDFHVYALPKSLSENDETKSYEQLMLSPVKTSLDKNAGIQAIDYTVAFKSDGYPYDERDTSYSGEIINVKNHIDKMNNSCDSNACCYSTYYLEGFSKATSEEQYIIEQALKDKSVDITVTFDDGTQRTKRIVFGTESRDVYIDITGEIQTRNVITARLIEE